MPQREVDTNPDNHNVNEDWEGNNAAFRCPVCNKIFIVTDNPIVPKSHDTRGVRRCPNCRKSTGHCHGGRKKGGIAYIEW
jgi:hypothetical protein